MSTFNIKWSDFSRNVMNSFRQLRISTHLNDVTLVSDDEHFFPANKVVLSAGSKYFETILRNNHQSQHTISLQGINNEEINLILDFLYYGEVDIELSKMDRFKGIAQRFKLHGLWNEKEINISHNSKIESKEIGSSSKVDIGSVVQSKSNTVGELDDDDNNSLDDDTSESTNASKKLPQKLDILKMNPRISTTPTYHTELNEVQALTNDAENQNREFSVSSRNTVNNEELRVELEEIQFTRKDDNEPNIYLCKNCDLKFDKFYRAKWHYERYHQNLKNETAILKDLTLYVRKMEGVDPKSIIEDKQCYWADLRNKLNILTDINEKRLNPNLKKKYSQIKQWLEMRINYSMNF